MFHVEWIQVAIDELSNLWTHTDSAGRRAITAATHALDQQLAADPYRESESRGGEDRVQFAYPLGVHIEIDPQKQIVWVLHVWRYRRRGV
jgi:hypothetical protein